eukprot:5567057-Karenia_brevis.AAC.1
MPITLAAGKGRSGSDLVKFTLREAAAHALATGCVFYTRWVPSEHNVADGPSPGRRPDNRPWNLEEEAAHSR